MTERASEPRDQEGRSAGPAPAPARRLLVCAPLGLEARSVRRGLVDGGTRRAAGSVVRTGYGRRRAGRAAQGLGGPHARGFDALAVAGVAGALTRDMRPGDLVVATEVREPGHPPVSCGSAELLAGALRRQGLTVHTGPVVTSDHLVTGDERARLAATGALAVDVESAELVRAAGERPWAVVRAVVDGPERALLRPGTVTGGLTALRSLRRAAAALDRWAAATGPRDVLLASPRSFCAGVERATEVVERALAQRGAPVYVRRQIVHNVHVVEDLRRRGAVFVEELDEVPAGATVIFSAHGVSPAVREEAARRGLDAIDATCPLVTKVHAEARRFAARGDTVVLIGHAGHEETEGTLGEAPDDTVLVETAEEVADLQVADSSRVSYLMQTTLAVSEAAGVADALRARFPNLQGPSSDDICYATTNRQEALAAVAGRADLVLVVGSSNSSNSRRLVEIARASGVPAHLVDGVGDVDPGWLTGARTVGLTAGASAPPALVEQVVACLRGLGPVEVEERPMTTESVSFTLPKEVRPS